MYKEVIIGWFKHFDFLLLDAGLLEVSLIIAYWLRHGFGGVRFEPSADAGYWGGIEE